MLTVGAYEENAHARAFYRRGGFEEIGSREDELTGSREYWTEWKERVYDHHKKAEVPKNFRPL